MIYRPAAKPNAADRASVNVEGGFLRAAWFARLRGNHSGSDATCAKSTPV